MNFSFPNPEVIISVCYIHWL